MFVIEPSEKIKVSKSIRLSAELAEELERIAKEKGISLSNLIGQCCEYALHDLPSTKE